MTQSPRWHPVDRARATVILARIRLYEAPDEANELFAQVVAEAEGDRETLAVAHEGFASCSFWMFKQLDEGLRHSEVALALALEIGDEALAADVLITLLSAEALLGRPSAETTADRTAALQDSAADRRIIDQPLVALAEYWKWVDSHERARAVLVDLMRHAHDLGDENARFSSQATSSAFSEISKPRSIVPEPGKRRPTSRDPVRPGTTSRSRPLFRPSWVGPTRRETPPAACSERPATTTDASWPRRPSATSGSSSARRRKLLRNSSRRSLSFAGRPSPSPA